MIAYLFVSLMPILVRLAFPLAEENKKQRKSYLLCCFFILLLFLGFRSQFVGNPDTENYCNTMKFAINSPSWEAFYYSKKMAYETGFLAYVFALSRIFNDPQWLIFISSAFFLVSVFNLIYKYSCNTCISLSLYISLGFMTFQAQAMRQALAISICLYAYDCAVRRKTIWFLILNLIAFFIHQTAIVFLIVLVLSRMRYSKIKTTFVILASIVFIFFADFFVDYANVLFSRNYSNKITSGGYIMTALYVLVVIVALIWNTHLDLNRSMQNPTEEGRMIRRNKNKIVIRRKIDKRQYSLQERNDSLLLYISIVACVCYILRYTAIQAAERISFYFIFSQLLLFPNSLSDRNNSSKFNEALLVNLFCTALFMYRLLGSDLVPYYFFWQ